MCWSKVPGLKDADHSRGFSPDVVVVGNGVIGASIALRLAKDGLSVACVAPISPPRWPGASEAAGAMLGALGEIVAPANGSARDDWELELRLAAAARYPQWLDELENLTGSRPAGGMGTFVVASATRESDQAAIRAMEAAAVQYKQPYERVEIGDVPGLTPSSKGRPARVLSLPAEGWIDAPQLRYALNLAGYRTDRVCSIDDRVVRLIGSEDQVTGVITSSHKVIRAAETVLCAGAAIDEILSGISNLASIIPSILPAKGVSIILQNTSSAASRIRHVLRTPNRAFACGLHVVPRGTDCVYVGATNRVSRFREMLGGVTADELIYLLQGVTDEISSDLGRWDIAETTYGYRPLSVDGLPIVGRTSVDGLSVAGGTYRNGVLLAPVVADVVVRDIQLGKPEVTNRLSPYHVGRTGLTSSPSKILERGLAEFAELIEEPSAHWWRSQLPNLLVAFAEMAMDPDSNLRRRTIDLLDRYPLSEMVPEALIELLQEVQQLRASGL